MYTKYTSLGYNCEIAFVLEAFGFSQTHELFAWMWAPTASVSNMIDAGFKDLFEDGNLEPIPDSRMVEDKAYGIYHHSPFYHQDTNHFGGPRHKRIYEISKALINKKIGVFENEMTDGGRIAYIVKADGRFMKQRALNLRDILLRRRLSADFTVIVVGEMEWYEGDWNEPALANRYIRKFSPIETANEFDRESWARILQEFPVQKS